MHLKGAFMLNKRFTGISAGAAMLLSGCSTTVEIQVPQSNIAELKECLKDPSSTYTQPATPPLRAFGFEFVNFRAEAGGPDRLFVTDAMLQGDRLPLDDTQSRDAGSFKDTREELNASVRGVDAVFHHDVHQAMLASYNQLVRTGSSGAGSVSDISAEQVLDYVRRVRNVTSRDGWSAYAARQAAHIDLIKGRIGELRRSEKASQSSERLREADLELRQAEQQFIAATYISSYVKAYFRNGELVQLNWKIGNPVQNLEKLAGLSDPADQKFIQSILDRLPNGTSAKLDEILQKSTSGSIGRVASSGLVTRGGESLAMPAVTVSLDVPNPSPVTFTKVDVNAVMEDLVRVTFEAIFDSINQVPAVSNATGITLPKSIALADFSKIKPAIPGHAVVMSQSNFNQIDANASEASSMTSSGVANLIRGVNVAALNNEAVANTLTVMAGTTARKVTERVSWCYYAVLNVDSTAQPKGSRTVTFNLSHGLLGL